MLLILGTVAVVSLGIYAVFIEPLLLLRVSRHKVVLTPDAADNQPLTISVLTDLHACWPWMGPKRIARIVRRANQFNPDVVALLGDYHTAMHPPFAKSLENASEWAAPLSGLKSKLGTFGVLGNHDWLEGGEEARDALEQSRVTVLENEALRIATHGNSHIWIIGLGDQYGNNCDLQGEGRRDDLRLALSCVDEDEAPRILLAHEPDIFRESADHVDLTISGHTHGGQVRVPFVGALAIPSRLGRKYAKGQFEENNSTLIIGSGLGCSGLPLRFLCPPELLLIEIYS